MAFKMRTGEENAEAVNVIISKSQNDYFGTVGTVGSIPSEGQDFAYRTIEMPVTRALEFALQKAKGSDVIIDMADDVSWDPSWGDLTN